MRRFSDNPITAAIATLALVVGSCSAVGGVLVERAANRKVCAAQTLANKNIRGLIDDFISKNPTVTPAQKAAADATARKRFPVKPC